MFSAPLITLAAISLALEIQYKFLAKFCSLELHFLLNKEKQGGIRDENWEETINAYFFLCKFIFGTLTYLLLYCTVWTV